MIHGWTDFSLCMKSSMSITRSRMIGKLLSGCTVTNFPIIRDLVIDMEDFMHKLKSVQPWIIRKQELPLGAGEHRQTTAQIDEFKQFSQCINCMLCYSACPVYGLNNEFLGPAAIALPRRYNLDSRDEGLTKRLPLLADSEGVCYCSFVGECSVGCPQGVDPAT